MTLVTILGRKAREAEYFLERESWRAALTSVAVVTMRSSFSCLIPFYTREAQDETLPVLRPALPAGTALRPGPLSESPTSRVPTHPRFRRGRGGTSIGLGA